ncbi:MAG: c-type cytochrome [Cyclobacteriaceae bacterium]|nr:c-type cytochrome [Cyclobacteriaceae bacterium]MDH4296572.1 c-type cytochrome [Cyclobacteriaceae bacterium]MDH5248775.1 c-type cytochrome [Cyclobacteriaceae bacterium]
MREDSLLKFISYLNCFALVCVLFIAGAATSLFLPPPDPPQPNTAKSTAILKEQVDQTSISIWQPPDSTKIENTPEGDLIRYGRELVAHTALYLGPKGKLMAISNGMNCQNCHLKAGKKPFGNSYAAVAATYPKKRARSGQIESVERRVNDCIERSLNGRRLDENSTEMRAFVAYIKWVGSEVPKGVYPNGAGLLELPLLNRPADAAKGMKVFEVHCMSCHGLGGEGFREGNSPEWKYPPLSHDNSFNVGAGLFRLSRFAAYVKSNMPYGASYDNPTLTDEEAWDVAAYINSLPRPGKDLSQDWPDISTKPFDHPFGPYADTFSEQQHKFGPFGPIKDLQKKN